MKNDEIIGKVIELSGGEDNINSYFHCMTRLRVTVKDNEKFDPEEIKKLDKVKGYMRAGDQHQIIFGPGLVEKMYDEMKVKLPALAEGEVPEDDTNEKKSLFSKFVTMITGIFMSLLGCLAGLGMLQGIMAILIIAKVLIPDSPEYIFLAAIAQAMVGFFPVVIGYAAMKQFGQDPVYGIVIGIVLVGNTIATMGQQVAEYLTIAANPALTKAEQAAEIAQMKLPEMHYLFKGTPFELTYFIKILGIPLTIPVGGYAGGALLTIATCWLTARLIKFFKKVIPDVVALFFVPMLSLTIGLFVGLLFFAPPINILQELMTIGLEAMLNLNPVIYGAIMGSVWPLLVMFGLHWPVVVLNMLTLASGPKALDPAAYTQLLVSNIPINFAFTGVLIAMMIIYKNNKKLKENFISCAFGTVFGITEPALYTVFVKNKAALIIGMLGGGIGGALIMAFDLKQYRGGGLGIFQLPVFLDPVTPNMTTLLQGTGFCLIAFVVSFTVALAAKKVIEANQKD